MLLLIDLNSAVLVDDANNDFIIVDLKLLDLIYINSLEVFQLKDCLSINKL